MEKSALAKSIEFGHYVDIFAEEKRPKIHGNKLNRARSLSAMVCKFISFLIAVLWRFQLIACLEQFVKHLTITMDFIILIDTMAPN